MNQNIDFSTVIDFFVALIALYAALLSTLTFVIQQREKKPKLLVKLEVISFLETTDSYNIPHRRLLPRNNEPIDVNEKRKDVLQITAINAGNTDISLVTLGVMLHNHTILYSEKIKGNKTLLNPNRSFKWEIPLNLLHKTVDKKWFYRFKLNLIGFYKDETGLIYLSKKMKVDDRLQNTLYGKPY